MSIKVKTRSIYKYENGDTIIEVLISVAILSSVFISCYAIINKSVMKIQQAKIHAQAIQLVQSQVEDYRAYFDSNGDPGQLACFYISGNTLMIKNPGPCYLNSSGTLVPASQTPNFRFNITNTGSNPKTYTFTATWPDGSSTDSVSEEYRIQ
jgi:Tfp pilus assembly protein PilV